MADYETRYRLGNGKWSKWEPTSRVVDALDRLFSFTSTGVGAVFSVDRVSCANRQWRRCKEEK